MKKGFLKICTLVLAFSLLFTMLLTGCGSKEDTSANDTSSDTSSQDSKDSSQGGKDVKISIWAYPAVLGTTKYDANATHDAYYKWIASQLKEKMPNITTEIEIIPFNGGNEKVNVAVASGSAPDILQDTIMRNLDYANRGKMLPLDDIFTDEEIADYYDGILDAVKLDGKIYVSPLYTNPVFFAVNVDMFKEAGAYDLLPKDEDKTWTYDEFIKACKAVSKGDVYGYGLYAGNEQGDAHNFAMIWGAGAATFNEDRSQCVLNSPEGVNGLDFILKLDEEKVVPPGAATLKASDTLQMFLNQKTAICMSSTGTFGTFEKAFTEGTPKFDYQVYSFPHAEGKAPKTVNYMNGYSIFDNKDADRAAAAKEYIKIANTGENLMVAHAAKGMPVRKSTGNLYEGDQRFTDAAKLVKFSGDYGFSVPGFSEIRAAFFPELQAALVKQKTSQQALDDFAKKANEILAKNK